MYGGKLQCSPSSSWWLSSLFCHPPSTWSRAKHQAAESKESGSSCQEQLAFLLGSLCCCWDLFLSPAFHPAFFFHREIGTHDSPNTTLRMCLKELAVNMQETHQGFNYAWKSSLQEVTGGDDCFGDLPGEPCRVGTPLGP